MFVWEEWYIYFLFTEDKVFYFDITKIQQLIVIFKDKSLKPLSILIIHN